jgi:hypothetical protein
MAVENPDNVHSQATSSASPEAGEDFYIGRFPYAEGQIDSRPVRFWGYIAFYGHVDESNTLTTTSLEHVALSENLSDLDDKGEFIGLFLTGPLHGAVELDQNTYELGMQLEHLNLAEQHRGNREDESMFPEVKTILTLHPVDISDRDKIQIDMTLKSEPVASDGRWGEVPQVMIGTPASPLRITFDRFKPKRIECVEAEPDDDRTVDKCWEVQIKPPGWNQSANIVHKLKVVFLLFSTEYDLEDQDDKAFIENLCRTQLTYVCKAWWHLCALRVVVWPRLFEDPVGDIYVHAGDKTKAKTLGLNDVDWEYTSKEGQKITKSKPCVEICLVDRIAGASPHTWAGGTFPETGSNGAYCLLNIAQANNLDYLLAHELGHVLRLNHPSTAPFPGSNGSIIDNDFVINPSNPQPDNTVKNVGLFVDGRQAHSAIVEPTGVDACFFTVDALP